MQKYLTLINASSGYHNMRLNKQSSYLSTFSHAHLADIDASWLPFGTVTASDMFQRKIDKIYQELWNVFYIADDTLVVGHDSSGQDSDKTLCRAPQICKKEILKLNKYKCHFCCTSVPFFGVIISSQGMRLDLRKLKVLTVLLQN